MELELLEMMTKGTGQGASDNRASSSRAGNLTEVIFCLLLMDLLSDNDDFVPPTPKTERKIISPSKMPRI
ncbi:hypothetical protein CEXT_36531 [Caerostris extrusa]|uniref:Uncharacterized protein n=1 Tax=Caerostris extrusa TaxID=172846 RepID=A0AAV4XVM0_CAEEX|nr:hypothetical protein CEXT_36531 [Caerostris extrusa]